MNHQPKPLKNIANVLRSVNVFKKQISKNEVARSNTAIVDVSSNDSKDLTNAEPCTQNTYTESSKNVTGTVDKVKCSKCDTENHENHLQEVSHSSVTRETDDFEARLEILSNKSDKETIDKNYISNCGFSQNNLTTNLSESSRVFTCDQGMKEDGKKVCVAFSNPKGVSKMSLELLPQTSEVLDEMHNPTPVADATSKNEIKEDSEDNIFQNMNISLSLNPDGSFSFHLTDEFQEILSESSLTERNEVITSEETKQSILKMGVNEKSNSQRSIVDLPNKPISKVVNDNVNQISNDQHCRSQEIVVNEQQPSPGFIQEWSQQVTSSTPHVKIDKFEETLKYSLNETCQDTLTPKRNRGLGGKPISIQFEKCNETLGVDNQPKIKFNVYNKEKHVTGCCDGQATNTTESEVTDLLKVNALKESYFKNLNVSSEKLTFKRPASSLSEVIEVKKTKRSLNKNIQSVDLVDGHDETNLEKNPSDASLVPLVKDPLTSACESNTNQSKGGKNGGKGKKTDVGEEDELIVEIPEEGKGEVKEQDLEIIKGEARRDTNLNNASEDNNVKEIKNKKAVTFVSENPEENNDNNNPEWEILKKLESDEERYKAVRMRWRNLTVPDPNRNLTCIHIRTTFKHPNACQPQFKKNDEKARNTHKRSASYEPTTSTDDVATKRSRTRSCTTLYDIKVQNHYKQWEEEEKKFFQRKRDALAGTQKSYDDQFYWLVRSGMVVYNNWEYQNRVAYLRNKQREAEEAVHRSFSGAYGKLHDETHRKISVFKKAMGEVEAFHKFYRKLDENAKHDCFFLTENELDDVMETDKLYEKFNTFYS